MSDEFNKSLLLWAASFALYKGAYRYLGGATNTQGSDFWDQLAFVAFIVPFVGTWFIAPFIQRLRKRRALQELHELFAAGRYLDTLTKAKRARRLWPRWPDPVILQGNAELLLWRIDAARATFHGIMTMGLGLEATAERAVFTSALVAAELAGDAERARERVINARYADAHVLLSNLIRAAREREHTLVLELAADEDRIPRAFHPLARVLAAWSREEESPQAIDPIPLLGETGLEQVEKVWPDLADFIKRAPRP